MLSMASPSRTTSETRIVESASGRRSALVLYGSETGNAQDVAEETGRLAERHYFDTTVIDIDSVPLKDLAKHTIIVFCISTQGQGEMPQNARSFWKSLLSSALKPGILRRVRFTSFGLGDSSYAQYNVAHRMLHGRLLQLGARPFCERGEGNEQHPEGFNGGLREWFISLKNVLNDLFPLPAGTNIRSDDEFIEPKWKLETVQDPSSPNGYTNSRPSSGLDCPSIEPVPIRGAKQAQIQANERVTSPEHFQDVRLLDLRMDETFEYGPGALAVIYPKNFPNDIQDFIDLMGWQEVADHPLELRRTSSRVQHALLSSPLRSMDVRGVTLTLRWLLENVLDFMAIPRRSFFANLLFFAGVADEDEKYQKERLIELANPELIDELWDYTTRPRRTILEVMTDFTKVKIPWQYALTILPTMRGRQFSICSGGHLRKDEQGRTRIQLLIAIADPPSPIIKYRRRYGVCTRYVATLQAGQTLSMGLQTGYLDVQPEELHQPLVMIGPGTGLAPMRSLIWQRVAWSRNLKVAESCALKDDILVFGCRAENADFYFREEWGQLGKEEGLQTAVAFSRDKQHPRQYVQDQIRANATNIFTNLVRRQGKIYVCGSSGNMPKGVREALLDIYMEQSGASREEAENYLLETEKQGRYKQETW